MTDILDALTQACLRGRAHSTSRARAKLILEDLEKAGLTIVAKAPEDQERLSLEFLARSVDVYPDFEQRTFKVHIDPGVQAEVAQLYRDRTELTRWRELGARFLEPHGVAAKLTALRAFACEHPPVGETDG